MRPLRGLQETRVVSLPLGLALGSPIFPSGCEGKLGVALESLHHTLEKEMATHSSVLAWRIPGMGEPGGLLSLGSHRVRHD